MMDVYTANEVACHNDEEDLWIVIHGQVYDLTSFLKEHPGGEEVLLSLAGGDGTECFDNIGHSEEAILLRQKFRIGELIGAASASQSNREQEANTEKKEPATTDDDDWQYEAPKEEKSWLSIYITFVIIVYAIIIYYLWS